MSWFHLKDQPKRNLRKGIWLRLGSLPEDLTKKILNFGILSDSGLFSGEMRIMQIRWIEIKEIRPDDQVLLEVWSMTSEDFSAAIRDERPARYTVFQFVEDENPDWVCEGDLGRGLVESKPAKNKS